MRKIFGLFKLVRVLFLDVVNYITQKIEKEAKKTLAMVPTDLRYIIGTKIYTKDVHVTSLDECSGRYGANNKTIIIFGTVLEVEIGAEVNCIG